MIKKVLIFSTIFISILFFAIFSFINSVTVKDFLKRFLISKTYYSFNAKLDIKDINISYFSSSVNLEGISLNLNYENYDLNLTSDKAKVNFNLVELLFAKIKINKLIISDSNIKINIKNNLNEELDYHELYSSILKDIPSLQINNLNLDILTLKQEVNLKDIDLILDKKLILNTKFDISIAEISSSIDILKKIKASFAISNNSIKIKKINLNDGDFIFDGLMTDLKEFPNSTLKINWDSNDFSLESLFGFLSLNYNISGKIDGSGSFLFTDFSNLKKIESNFNGSIYNLKFQQISFPKVVLSAGYNNFILDINKASFLDKEDKGIEIYNTKIFLNSPYKIEGSGSINGAELSEYLEFFDINRCLAFTNVLGKFSFTGNISSDFEITSLVDLKVNDFWVLKEKGLIPNKENSILNFEEGSLYGFVKFSPKGAYFDNIIAKQKSNEFYLNGWIYDDSTVQINIKSDKFNFINYKRLGNLDISGVGTLTAQLLVDETGSFSAVGDFDFKDASLMNEYFLGDVKSRVLYQDRKSLLSFQRISGKVGYSEYQGYSNIKFSKEDITLDSSFRFDKFYSYDFLTLLKKDGDIVGNPSGVFSGQINFSGLADWEKIKITSNLKAKEVEFFGEIFDSFFIDLSYENQNFNIDRARLTRSNKSIHMKSRQDNENTIINIVSDKIAFGDFNFLLKNDIYLNGLFKLNGDIIFNKNNFKKAKLNFALSDLKQDDKLLDPISIVLEYFKEGYIISFDIFDKKLLGTYEFKKEKHNLNLLFDNLDLYNLTKMFSVNLEKFNSNLSGEINFENIGKELGIEANIKEFMFDDNIGTMHAKDVFFKKKNSFFDIAPFSIISQTRDTKNELKFSKENGVIAIKGSINSFILSFYKNINASVGFINLDLKLDKDLDGIIDFSNLDLKPNYSLLGNLRPSGKISIRKNLANFDEFKVYTGVGSEVSFLGNIDFSKFIDFKAPKLDLKAKVERLNLNFTDSLNGLKTTADGEVLITGSERPYLIKGDFLVYNSTYRNNFNIKELLSSFKKDTKNISGKPKKNLFNIDLGFNTSQPITVKNDIFKGEMTADLRIRKEELSPYLLGYIDINRGRLDYLSNTFEPVIGRVKFESYNTVSYNLNSETQIDKYKIYLSFTGDEKENKLRLNSVPALNYEDIISLIVTGTESSELSKGEEYNLTIGEGGQIISETFGVVDELHSKTGVNVRLKYTKTGDEMLPVIEVGKNLSDKVKVTYGKTLVDDVNKQEFNVQYDLNDNIELRFLVEDVKNVQEQEPSNAGFDIKFRFEF